MAIMNNSYSTKSPVTIVWKEKEIKFLIIGKETAKVSLSSSDMIVNLENSKPSTKKLLELIRAFIHIPSISKNHRMKIKIHLKYNLLCRKYHIMWNINK